MLVALEEHPRLRGLHVLIAVPGNGQDESDSVFELGLLQRGHVLFDLAIAVRQERVIFVEQAHVGHDSVEELLAEHQRPIDEVAEIVEQLRVVLGGQVRPAEARVLVLRADVEQVESPHVAGNARVLGVVPEDSDAPRFGELAVLVV